MKENPFWDGLTNEELDAIIDHMRDWSDGRVIFPDVLNREKMIRIINELLAWRDLE